MTPMGCGEGECQAGSDWHQQVVRLRLCLDKLLRNEEDKVRVTG